jgi:CheY-like chemotaxis protein
MAHTSIPDTASEHARVEALRRYAILDTGNDREFDELVQRAVRDCGYPTALISLMDADRCWFKATAGLRPADRNLRQLPREQTICNFAFRSSGIMVVADAREDERFQRLAFVDRSDGYCAYVGAQIITPDGFSIGTVCLLDTKPRHPTPEQIDTLRAIATRVMALLESRQRDLAPAASISIGSGPRADAPIHIAPPTLANDSHRQLVLIVDDEELIRGVTTAMISRLGCETRMAANGQEALERIAALDGRVRLVLTDIHMPVMNGVEMVRALRAQPNAPIIIAMSGKFTPEIRADLEAQGVTYLIAKPFGMAEIDRALKHAFAIRR